MAKLAIDGGDPVRKEPFPRWPVFGDEEREALDEVLTGGQWGIGGEKVDLLVEEFSRLHQTEFAVAVTTGTDALQIALTAASAGPGDEVIVPAYTFAATATAVFMANAMPVFVDIDPDTYCLDAGQIESAITGRTKAIIPVHLAGHSAEMDAIMSIARRRGLIVIEDCAQAHLAEWDGRKAGSIGDLGCFSFQSSKNITSGEGGMIVTNNRDFADKCWSLHNCGRERGGAWYKHPYLGGNFRMTQFQAALLLVQMDRAADQAKIRTENAAYLTAKFEQIEGIRPLKVDEHVTAHAYHLYILRYDQKAFAGVSREKFIEALAAEGIPAASGYVPLYGEGFVADALQRLNFLPSNRKRKTISLPVTERACNKEAVWLTQNLLLGTKEDMDSIVAAISKIKENIGDLVAK